MVKLTKTFIKTLVGNPIKVLDSLDENEVANIIQQANYAFFNTDKPIVSDNIFDLIKEYMEKKYPNNPIHKNIGAALDEDKKVELPYNMPSLDKVKTDEKLIEKFKVNYPGSYLISDKLDGISGMILVKDSNVTLYSRGDGTYGQNISHLLPFIRNIPSLKKSSAKYTNFAIRGELLCSRKDFEKFKNKMANARNMIAGLVNSKIPDLEIAAATQFVAYEIIHPNMIPEEQMKELKVTGFKPVNHQILESKDFNVSNLSDILVKTRKESEFECDGIVVIHNDIHKRIKDNPKYGFAFKSVQTMEKGEVIVTNVEWTMSKDGYLIPVVEFHAINLNGVTIKRAHGFNGKFIKDNIIGPGSKIIIIRSGDVIPYISEILNPSDNGKPQMPIVNFEWSSTGVDIIAKDTDDNDELKYKNIEYFFTNLDIVGMGPGTIKKIFDGGFKTVKLIFDMSKDDFLKIPGFQNKTAEKLTEALKIKRNNIDCITLMDASNMMGRGMGSRKIKLITDIYPKIITNDYVPTVNELISIKGIEVKTAEKFIENLPKYFKFRNDNGLKCISEKKIVVIEEKPGSESKKVSFVDQKVVFTGFRSKVLEEFITSRGGSVTTAVSKNTTLLIRKDDEEESSKITKANELNIKIMKLSEFENTYNIKAK
jgi:NAD-dependent DNA ligase